MTDQTKTTGSITTFERAQWVESIKRICPAEDRIALARALLPDRFMVVDREDIRSPFVSCLGGEQAKERLREINTLSYEGASYAR